MSAYQLKLEAVEEYLDALHYKKVNEELCDSLFGLLGELSKHYERAGLPLPQEVSRIMERTSAALVQAAEAAPEAPPSALKSRRRA